MAVRAVPPPLAQLPNALTVVRLVAVPVFVVLLLAQDGEGSWALAALFAAAALTDQVDGWLARRWHVQSEFGKFADPLADRLMIDSAAVILALDSRLQWYGAVLVVARDALLVFGYPLVRDRGYDFSVSFLGKTATWVLYAGLTGLIASSEGTVWPLWIFWIGAGLAIAAGALYVAKASREVKGEPR